jgi:type I restriction enzyme S subunit
MELKPGYKQTEVGVIPEDWDLRTLGSLTILLTNGFVGTATSAYVEGEQGVLYIQGYNVLENGFKYHGIKRVSHSFHAKNKKSFLQPGDLLTIQTGDIGVTAAVPPELAGANCHALIISRLNKRESDPRFYCQYFNSEKGRAAFKEIETGTTMKHLNCGDMKRLTLPSPPIGEQRAIATALSDVDALIAKLDQLIAKKRDLKRAAMQQLLTGKTRLPGFSGEWEVQKIGDFASCTAGGTPSTRVASYWGGSVRWMSSGELNLKYIGEVEGRITQAGLHNSSATMLPARCVLIGLAGQGKTRGTVAMNLVELCTNQSIAAVLPTSAFVPEYLYYNLDARYVELREMSTGAGGRGGLNLKIIKSVDVPLPPLPEQTAMATVLSDMDAEIAALEARRDKARALKQGMMQVLLTGQVRLI